MDKINSSEIKGAVAVIEKDGKFLLMKQSFSKPFGGQWRDVGGKFLPNENPIEGIKREVKEETNLDIEIVGNKHIAVLKRDDGPGYYYVYKAKYVDGELKIDKKEIEKIGWFTLEEIKKLNLMPSTRIFYEEYSNYLKSNNQNKK